MNRTDFANDSEKTAVLGSVIAEYFSTRELACELAFLIVLFISKTVATVQPSPVPNIVSCLPANTREKDWIALLLLVLLELGVWHE